MTAPEVKEIQQLVGKKEICPIKKKYFGVEEEVDAKMRLHGYTSCSLTRNKAESFMWENKESGHQKVLFHIKWNSDLGAYFLNTGAYEHEEEVLLRDGAELIVDSV